MKDYRITQDTLGVARIETPNDTDPITWTIVAEYNRNDDAMINLSDARADLADRRTAEMVFADRAVVSDTGTAA